MWSRIRDALVGLAAALAGTLLAILGIKRIGAEQDSPTGDRRPDAKAPRRTESTGARGQDDQPRLALGADTGNVAQAAKGRGVVPPGWTIPQPEHLSRPTYWPAVMSFGIVLVLWAVVTSPVMLALGLVLFGVALAGWIGDLREESRERGESESE